MRISNRLFIAVLSLFVLLVAMTAMIDVEMAFEHSIDAPQPSVMADASEL